MGRTPDILGFLSIESMIQHSAVHFKTILFRNLKMMYYYLFSARSINKLKDKDPPAAKCGDPLVKGVQKRSASF